jgi:hypothetical protein
MTTLDPSRDPHYRSESAWIVIEMTTLDPDLVLGMYVDFGSGSSSYKITQNIDDFFLFYIYCLDLKDFKFFVSINHKTKKK